MTQVWMVAGGWDGTRGVALRVVWGNGESRSFGKIGEWGMRHLDYLSG